MAILVMRWLDEDPCPMPDATEASRVPSSDCLLEEPGDALPAHAGPGDWKDESDLRWAMRLRLPIWEYRRLTPEALDERMERWRSGEFEGPWIRAPKRFAGRRT